VSTSVRALATAAKSVPLPFAVSRKKTRVKTQNSRRQSLRLLFSHSLFVQRRSAHGFVTTSRAILHVSPTHIARRNTRTHAIDRAIHSQLAVPTTTSRSTSTNHQSKKNVPSAHPRRRKTPRRRHPTARRRLRAPFPPGSPRTTSSSVSSRSTVAFRSFDRSRLARVSPLGMFVCVYSMEHVRF